MATTRAKYVEKCEEIVAAQPVYKKGAANRQECDCIGMTKYGLRENGVSISTTGTNYTARFQVDGLRKIGSAADLSVGDVVFKAYEQGESGWGLDQYPKYMPGGKCYTGDLRDYYHIGTVASLSPLKIIHMTSPSAKTDTKIGKWGFVASLKSSYISDNPEPGPEPDPPTPVQKTMKVYSENGKPVNLRTGPKRSCKLVDKVPVGEIVEVSEEQNEWSHVTWGRKTGWMMTEFLVDPSQPGPEPEPDPPVGDTATVWSENGNPVRMRSQPTTSCRLYERLPVGTVVTVIAYDCVTDSKGTRWSQISHGSRKGWYIMSEFLKII